MSKNINVNPNFYKVGGREHAEGHGEAIPHAEQKEQLAKNRSRRTKQGDRNFIPGAAPVGKKTKR